MISLHHDHRHTDVLYFLNDLFVVQRALQLQDAAIGDLLLFQVSEAESCEMLLKCC